MPSRPWTSIDLIVNSLRGWSTFWWAVARWFGEQGDPLASRAALAHWSVAQRGLAEAAVMYRWPFVGLVYHAPGYWYHPN